MEADPNHRFCPNPHVGSLFHGPPVGLEDRSEDRTKTSPEVDRRGRRADGPTVQRSDFARGERSDLRTGVTYVLSD